MTAPVLPPGYRARPAVVQDVGAIHHLVAAGERELYGRVVTDRGAASAVLARPGLVPEADTLLVHDREGRLAARAWVNRRCQVDVHPAHRGRGLGAALLGWAEHRARESGGRELVQTVPDGDTGAVALLRSRGYRPMVTEWLLEIALRREPAVPEPPAGLTVRPFRAGDGREAHDAYLLVQDAFAAWQKRRMPYPEWAQHTVERDSFAPQLSMLAFTGGRLVGVLLALDMPECGEGRVQQLAVRRDHRGKGVARLLLGHAFRAVHRYGRPTCGVWTHSETGALAVYQRAGMTVRHTSTVYRGEL